MFQLHPVGKHHLQLCGTTPCMLRGAEELKDVCRRRIGAPFEATADGLLSWEEMECLGACVNAPVVAIDGYYHEDLTPESLEARIDALIAGTPMAPGSAAGRETSAPQGPSATLLDPALYDGALGQPIALPNRPEPASA
jgi:NADH-quinone oxidoreductase subunit E